MRFAEVRVRTTVTSGAFRWPPEGEAVRVTSTEDGDIMLTRCPGCGVPMWLRDHELHVDDDGRPTASPSCVCPECGFHGWLKEGRWTL